MEGLETRFSDLTKNIPKPMIQINKKPILELIIRHYINYGISEFILATGFKQNIIKNIFKI